MTRDSDKYHIFIPISDVVTEVTMALDGGGKKNADQGSINSILGYLMMKTKHRYQRSDLAVEQGYPGSINSDGNKESYGVKYTLNGENVRKWVYLFVDCDQQ